MSCSRGASQSRPSRSRYPLEQPQLRHPVQLAGELVGVGFEPAEHRFPPLEDVTSLLVGVLPLAIVDELPRPVVVLGL